MRIGFLIVFAFGIWAGISAGECAAADDRQRINGLYRVWIEQELWPRAQQYGISAQTFRQALSDTLPDWDLPDLQLPGHAAVPKGRQRQAEFRSPGRYFNADNIAALTRRGRTLLKTWQSVLERIEKTYGVSRYVVMAIWGRESAYGTAPLRHFAIRSLSTLAFMGRRKAMFEAELLAALKILQEGHARLSRLNSSWAGGLGQAQFLPRAYLRYSVDFDGDGRRDIWRSVPDTLASIANYLHQNGWQRDRDWGFEVQVPADVSCVLEGPDRGQTIAAWRAAGIRRVRGRRFAGSEHRRQGYLLMPAGRAGPAFIATDNFFVLKTFNESDVYALFVGHLADRYRGGGGFAARWKPVQGLERRAIYSMQKHLEGLGYDVGGADGLAGFKTRRSIGAWQVRAGLSPTCFPTPALLRRLL